MINMLLHNNLFRSLKSDLHSKINEEASKKMKRELIIEMEENIFLKLLLPTTQQLYDEFLGNN